MSYTPHTLLPLGLQRLLVMASQTEPHIAKGESFIRTVKIEHAIDVVRSQCPDSFVLNHERK